jgi:hypothetical protein
MKVANRSFENASQFKYLGMTATNQNLIQEEIKRIIRIYKSIILPVDLYWCEA